MKSSKLLKIVLAFACVFAAVVSVQSTARAYTPGQHIYLEGVCWTLVAPFVPTRAPQESWWIEYYGPTCPAENSGMGSVRGSAFMDKNENGKWDVGEAIFGEAWYKVTDGGSWFTCGYVGSDASFGVPVSSGTYYVMPVAPKGYKTTTPRVKVTVQDSLPTLGANIGFVADPTAKGEACDQYNPARP